MVLFSVNLKRTRISDFQFYSDAGSSNIKLGKCWMSKSKEASSTRHSGSKKHALTLLFIFTSYQQYIWFYRVVCKYYFLSKGRSVSSDFYWRFEVRTIASIFRNTYCQRKRLTCSKSLTVPFHFPKEMPADSARVIAIPSSYYLLFCINCCSCYATLCTKIIIPTLLWFSIAFTIDVQSSGNSLPDFTNTIH